MKKTFIGMIIGSLIFLMVYIFIDYFDIEPFVFTAEFMQYLTLYLIVCIIITTIFRRPLMNLWMQRFYEDNKRSYQLLSHQERAIVWTVNTVVLPLSLIDNAIYLIRRRKS